MCGKVILYTAILLVSVLSQVWAEEGYLLPGQLHHFAETTEHLRLGELEYRQEIKSLSVAIRSATTDTDRVYLKIKQLSVQFHYLRALALTLLNQLGKHDDLLRQSVSLGQDYQAFLACDEVSGLEALLAMVVRCNTTPQIDQQHPGEKGGDAVNRLMVGLVAPPVESCPEYRGMLKRSRENLIRELRNLQSTLLVLRDQLTALSPEGEQA